MTTLATLRCACGSPDLIAILPGQDSQYAPHGWSATGRGEVVGDLFDDAVADRAWCCECWPVGKETAA